MYGKLYRHVLMPLYEGGIRRRRTLRYWADAQSSQWWAREKLEAKQLESLKRLLRHAYDTCPFYSEQWRANDLNPETISSLEDFTRWPLVSREEVRAQRASIGSSAPEESIEKSTGGSTGEQVTFDVSRDSLERRTAMTYRGYGFAGGAPGSRQLHIWVHPLDRLSRRHRWKRTAHIRIQNQLFMDCLTFSPDRMREHFRVMNRYRPEVIVAYTNPIYEFARYLDEHKLKPFSPRSIIVGAEKLHDFQREMIETVFGAPVFETYGSREFMLIGAECEHHGGLHLSMENLLVEVVNDDGRPTPPGEEGNVVVTDLYNYAMPFVRYMIGDRAIAGWEMCPCRRGLPLLKKVVGRRLDTLRTPDGRILSGELFPVLINNFPSVRRFQVVQTTVERIEVRLVLDGAFGDTEQAILLADIHERVGMEVEVDLKVVDEIPLTSAGKRRVVVRSGC